MEIAISVILAVASLFVSTRVRSDLGRLGFVGGVVLWAFFVVFIYADGVVRAAIASEGVGKNASTPFVAGILKLYGNLEGVGVCLLLCVATLAVLAIVPRPSKAS
ncbi:hypothetical protein [Lysobacter enzymogenes]|uniref:hypothetical protein n=1 Tax=Lysobacter enzymogenes TaxID=69 RepID=UPI0011160055|nr:hypothetical protein [Lysobacter enzymogenes]QQP99658.1 hypothetical protein JHW41_16225 [Lysobacter enzymogenes]UZW59098.1 hypothetical protein BV903_017525 [Lysobacter enzymogenes]